MTSVMTLDPRTLGCTCSRRIRNSVSGHLVDLDETLSTDSSNNSAGGAATPTLVMATTVLLSVGGKLFTTTYATLTSPFARGSMLETLAGMHRDRDRCGPYMPATDAKCCDPRHPRTMFIDRDGVNFSYILNYLR